MLDSRSSIVLRFIINILKKDTYILVDYDEILSYTERFFTVDINGLKNILEFLDNNEYIKIKYFKEGRLCLAVLPKGRLYFEENRELFFLKRQVNKISIITIALSILCSTIISLIISLF